LTDNRLFYGDNLDVLREHVPSASVDLVYLDPPFNSDRNYNVIFARNAKVENNHAAQIQAFSDTWSWTPATEKQYADAIAGGLPSSAADASW
jgi:16S rRNA G966 N2-methylase RsmD